MSERRWRRAVPSRAVLVRATGVVAAWLVVCAVLLVFGGRPDPALVALTLLAVLATWGTVRSALSGDEAGEEAWRLPRDEPVRPPGHDPRLDLMERLVEAHLVSRAGDVQLPRHLVRLADQRLMDRYGIHREAEPERAAALLGPELLALADGTGRGHPGDRSRPDPARTRTSAEPRRRLSPAAVDALLTRIEAL
jgi:hypothetical protein